MIKLFAAAFALMAPLHAMAQLNAGPYVPSPSIIVEKMLDLAGVSASDFLIDLGSGDGRIVIQAAQQRGASGMGIDLNDKLVKLANDNAARAGVAERVSFVQGDLFKADLSQASVVTAYLLPDTVTKLVPKLLAELRPGTRVVSHDYPLTPWPYEKVVQFELEEKIKISGTTRTVLYLYIVPPKEGGRR